jgi:hypothetical protein
LSTETPRLSVVIAARVVPATFSSCVNALVAQSMPLELVLADGSDDADMLPSADRYPGAVHLHLPKADLPRLKAHGLRHARGSIVAIVDPTARVAPDWATQVLAAFEDAKVQGAGGVVTLEGPRTPGNLAAYLFEYGAFNPPIESGLTNADLPGNNVAYRREPLLRVAGAVLDAEGFNKPFVHSALRAAGGELHVFSSMRVTHMTEYGLLKVATRLFHYGRYFGHARMRRSSPGRRALYVAFAPAVPALLLARHVRRAVAMPQNRALLGRSAGALVIACSSWAAGEWLGSWFGAGDSEVA